MALKKTTPRHEVEKLASCAKCGHCCRHGSGYVLPEDITRIASHLGMTEIEFRKEKLEELELFNAKIHRVKTERKGKPFGPCIFLVKDSCSIHEVKPFHCRIGACNEHGQEISLWFMLNYLLNPDDPESIRQYRAYLNTHPTLEGGELEALVPDRERLQKMLEYER